MLRCGVSTIEDFVVFAEALPRERRLRVDEILASILLANGVDLTADELADLNLRRTGKPDAAFDEAEIRARLLGLRWWPD